MTPTASSQKVQAGAMWATSQAKFIPKKPVMNVKGRKSVAKLVRGVVELLQHGEERIDQLVDHQVEQEREAPPGEVGVGLDPLPQPVQRIGRLDMDTDQVLG